MIEGINTLIDIDEETLNTRISLIRVELEKKIEQLRNLSPEDLSLENIDNDNTRRLILLNLILGSTVEGSTAQRFNFNMFLYIMYVSCKQDIDLMLDQYDLDIEKNSDGEIVDIKIIVKE